MTGGVVVGTLTRLLRVDLDEHGVPYAVDDEEVELDDGFVGHTERTVLQTPRGEATVTYSWHEDDCRSVGESAGYPHFLECRVGDETTVVDWYEVAGMA